MHHAYPRNPDTDSDFFENAGSESALRIRITDPQPWLEGTETCVWGEQNPARTDMSHVYISVDSPPLDGPPLVALPNAPPHSVDFKVYVKDFTSRYSMVTLSREGGYKEMSSILADQ